MMSLGLQVSFFIYTIINYTNWTFIIIGFIFTDDNMAAMPRHQRPQLTPFPPPW